MDVLINFVIPILGLLLAIVGAWDKLAFAVKHYSNKRIENKIKKIECDLEQLEKYKKDQAILTAYLFKQTFLLITVVFFASLVSKFPETSLESQAVNVLLSTILSWFAGFFAGRGIRVTNFVLNYSKIKEKLEKKLEKLNPESPLRQVNTV
ncbi:MULTISPECIES: hypothetical protein [Shewanella]|uniref:DUF106 domain-containing protein n=1 Tax=Shewanella marisflavi TaxID=260364 RepID=A0ABX5WKH7_9GAMM|nr:MULTISPECIES: hypothetical protein [Shewanella]QDF75042.1 hypothetical protein FGA12_07635 [Shewanella marisflavi]